MERENTPGQFSDTGQLREAEDFQFTPMILEAHSGAWSPTARKVLDWLACGQSAAKGVPKEAVSLIIAQRLSIALHRENARAILKRTSSPVTAPTPSGWASSDDSVDEAEC